MGRLAGLLTEGGIEMSESEHVRLENEKARWTVNAVCSCGWVSMPGTQAGVDRLFREHQLGWNRD